MKNLITPNYVFTPGGPGVGTLKTNIINFDIKLLLAVVNVTRETIIYSSALSGRGYTNLSGDTITLEFDTTGFSSSDVLQVFYDSTVDYPSVISAPRINDLIALMERLVKTSETLQVVDSAQRQRISIDSTSFTTINPFPVVASQATATNLKAEVIYTTSANLPQIGGMDREQYINIAKQTYAQSIRSRLTIQ